MGYPSTIAYVAAAAGAVLEHTGLLPHINAGVMSQEELRMLKSVSVSQGLMLESLSRELIETPGAAHYNCPDKEPVLRLEMLDSAGKEKVAFTTGILIGIGETRLDRIEALLAIKHSHQRYRHVQEVIIQNFRAKKGTAFENLKEPSLDDFLWTIAAARLILGKYMSIQAPPNLTPESDDVHKQPRKPEKEGDKVSNYAVGKSGMSGKNISDSGDSGGGDTSWRLLIDAGINDWGGVSPLTRDYVNPERPWPHILSLASVTAAAGKHLVPRLPVYPSYFSIDVEGGTSGNSGGGGGLKEGWLDGSKGAKSPLAAVLKNADVHGLARASNWYAGMIENHNKDEEEKEKHGQGKDAKVSLSSTTPTTSISTAPAGNINDVKRRAVPLPRQKKPWRIAMDTNGLLVGDTSITINEKPIETSSFFSTPTSAIESLLSCILQSSSSNASTSRMTPIKTSSSTSTFDITEEDISLLFSARGSDFSAVVAAADQLRRQVNGDTVTYVVNRNINYTNICTFGCKFCAFSKGPAAEELRGAPYLLDFEEVSRRTAEAWARGATEVCMQGGIHPDFTGDTYLKLISAAKFGAPDIHVHAFSPLEVAQGASTLGWSLHRYLSALKDAGLGSLPGTAAEILDDAVRAELCPDKLSTQEWVDVITTAHSVGLKTTSTIMFGHVDSITSWARHLLILRDIAAKTGKITEFVPLPFVHMEAPMFRKGISRAGPTLRESILMHSIARLALHPYITNIQASWVKMSPNRAARLLAAGCNDMGGVLMNESITRAAGAEFGQELGALEMERLIREAGRVPEQRNTLYGRASMEQRAVSLSK
jgi:FO synthase